MHARTHLPTQAQRLRHVQPYTSPVPATVAAAIGCHLPAQSPAAAAAAATNATIRTRRRGIGDEARRRTARLPSAPRGKACNH